MGNSSSLAPIHPIHPIRPSRLQMGHRPRADGNRPGRSWPLLARTGLDEAGRMDGTSDDHVLVLCAGLNIPVIFLYHLSESCTTHQNCSPTWTLFGFSPQRSSLPDVKPHPHCQPSSQPASQTKNPPAVSGRFCRCVDPKLISPHLGQPEANALGSFLEASK
ncbi:MAG: hypothetical protein L6R36_005200 [Xanthoria steineri]|nr:MAG: hypothetical protein L6R36_005200 [Xanthoria steineri]